MKITVLGGLGIMAEAALHDLAANPLVTEVVAADLRLERRKAAASRLSYRRKVRFAAVDLTETAKAARTLRGSRILLNAAWYEHNLKAMDLALALKAHYIDLGGLYHMTLKQLRRAEEFRKAGLLCVLGCGSTPGIANMMVAEMSEPFETIDTVGIYDAAHDPPSPQEGFLPPFSIRTMLDEYILPAPIWEGGCLVEAPPHSRVESLEFKPPIGKCAAGAVIHSEVATLPAYLSNKGIRNLAFKIVYPDAVKAQLGLLVAMGLHRSEPVRVDGASVSPRGFVTALAQAGASRAQGPPRDFEVLRVRMTGTRMQRPFAREWDCEMRPSRVLTAGAMGVGFPAAIAASLILKGHVSKASGVYAPESCLRRSSFFKELAARKTFRITERIEMPYERFAP